MKKIRLKRILDGFNRYDSNTDYVLRKSFKRLRKKTVRNALSTSTDEMSKRLESLRSEFDEKSKTIASLLDARLRELRNALRQSDMLRDRDSSFLEKRINTLKEDIDELSERKITIPDVSSEIKRIETELKDFEGAVYEDQIVQDTEKAKIENKINDVSDAVKKLRTDTMRNLANAGGGNANRNISVGGNASVLSRYTDLNIKAGSNITLSYSNNDATKNLDLTIASSGSGSGITREVNTTSVSSVIGSVAGIDYVTVASAGVALTLPTAVGNDNLYTIKNTAASSVLVVTAGSETIDGNSDITLATQFTAVDLISDGSNWHIT